MTNPDLTTTDAVLQERTRLADLVAAVGAALIQSQSLGEILHRCAEAMVTHLDAAFARIWTLNERDQVLELKASAGMYTHLDGPHSRVPLGQFKIGLIAVERKPHLTNDVYSDLRVGDREWARREGLVAFAGYPLLVGSRLVGVLGMFARKPLSVAVLQAMETIAHGLALLIERKRTEEALLDSGRRLQLALMAGRMGTWRWDAVTSAVVWDEALERIYGLAPGTFGGDYASFMSLVHPEDREYVHSSVAQAGVNGPEYEIEFRAIRPDGQVRWIADRGQVLFDARGGRSGLTGVCWDATDRKRAEQRLRVHHRVSQVLLEGEDFEEVAQALLAAVGETLGWSAGALWALDNSSEQLRCVRQWSRPDFEDSSFPALSKSTRFARSQGLPGEVWQRKEPVWLRDLEETSNFPRLMMARQAGLRSGFGFPLINGTHVLGVVELFSTTLVEPDPELVETIRVVGQQIGQFLQRWEGHKALRESEARHRAVLNTATDCIIAMDAEGRVAEFNPAAERTFGYAREQAVGQLLADLIIPPAWRDAHTRGLQRYLETGHGPVIDNRIEVAGLRSDGTEFPIELSVTRIPSEGPPFFTAYLRDISDRRRFEEMLRSAKVAAEQANLAKSQFLAAMSHELRTPLNAIIGYSEMLQEEATERGLDSLTDDLEKVHTAGRQLLALINDVLDLSKIESGRMEVFLEHFVLTPVVEEVLSTIRPLANRNGNRLQSRFGNLGAVNSDLTKLKQCLLNLLSNASKFTENGTVTLEAERFSATDGDRIRFRVIDTGIGISQEKLQQLFEPFSQADASVSRKYGGTGLGLALTRRLCRLMGGDISVESEPGTGSTFTIELPADASTQGTAEQIPVDTPADEEQACTVLVIDDDPVARDLLQRTIEREGYTVVTAANGSEGIQLARQVRPSMITLDVMMPGTDGWTVLSQIKGDPELAEIPVVMITINDDRNRGFALGATDFLLKPVKRERLARILLKHRCNTPPCRVLIVEDDPASRELLRDIFQKQGWVVAQAENGLSALQLVEDHKPSLILLDLMMPEMDGFDFVDALRRREDGRHIPIVVITAKELTAEERARLNGRVAQVISKGSVSKEGLMVELQKAIQARRPVHSRRLV